MGEYIRPANGVYKKMKTNEKKKNTDKNTDLPTIEK